MYILSLVHQREEGAKKTDDSPILAKRPLLSLRAAAEARKMTAGLLKKSQVNDDDEPNGRAGDE